MGPIKEYLYNCNYRLPTGQLLRDVFAAGLSNEQLASKLVSMMGEFKDPVMICCDHSMFDGRFNEEQQKLCHEFWKFLTHNCKKLKRLLRLQKINSGTTQKLLKYIAKFIRCSGEFTTSLENSLINFIMLYVVFVIFLSIRSYLIVNGDDSGVVMERSDWKKISVDILRTSFKVFGHDTKIDKVCDNVYDIDFCQSTPIKTILGWRMVRKPDRAMSRVQYTDKPFVGATLDRYMCGIILCEMSNVPGVPVMQAFYSKCLELFNYQIPVIYDKEYRNVSESIIKIAPITMEARHQFAQAFDIPVQVQICMEEQFALQDEGRLRKYINKNSTFHLRQYNRCDNE
jgi:hypothetical protein